MFRHGGYLQGQYTKISLKHTTLDSLQSIYAMKEVKVLSAQK